MRRIVMFLAVTAGVGCSVPDRAGRTSHDSHDGTGKADCDAAGRIYAVFAYRPWAHYRERTAKNEKLAA